MKVNLYLDFSFEAGIWLLPDRLSGGDWWWFHFAVSAADRALVVTTPHISAVRDAGRVLYLLESQRLSQVDAAYQFLQFRMVRKHDMLSQKDIEEILGMKSIGVIPADDKVIISQNQGCSRFIFAFKICKSIYECSTIVGQSADYSGRLKCGRSVHQARYTASFFRKGMWKWGIVQKWPAALPKNV